MRICRRFIAGLGADWLCLRASVGTDGFFEHLAPACSKAVFAATIPIFTPPFSFSRHKPKAIMIQKSYHVLFICTGNSARSIFAEALLRDLGGEKFVAHSAGIAPKSELNPTVLEILERNGHSPDGLRSQHVGEFQRDDAPEMDFVFTVCDTAAGEECPPWPGQAFTAHWGVPDPVKAEGSEAEKGYAFTNVYGQLRRRIENFVALPFAELDRVTLQARVEDLEN